MHGAKIKMNTTCQKNGQAGMKHQPAGKSNPERPSMGLLNCKQKCDDVDDDDDDKISFKETAGLFDRTIFVAQKARTTL